MEGGGEDPLLLGKQQRLEKLQKSIGMSGRPGALHDKGSWTIFATPRREKALDKSMGNVTKVFPGSTLTEDVLVTIVQQFNLEWVAMHDHVLDLQALSDFFFFFFILTFGARKDFSLRFTGNIAIEPEAMAMTVRDMYTFYQKLPHRHLVIETKLKLPKGTSMSFELATARKRQVSLKFPQYFLPYLQYNRRAFALSCNDVDSILGSGNKRKSSQQHTGSNGKRAKTGKSKDVHKLRIDGDKQIYVAKKLIDIGQGRAAEVSHTTTRDLLGRDLVRLTRMGSFRDEFFKFASEKAINELADFVISKGFIILVMAAEEEDEAEPEP
ncbi:hypothetical protein B0H13DRAFT_2342396 [Mycena leptocephala]|nr:hypothetical protein B0H13DRAFT_2342396 [Mycena leptocephala]